MKLGTYKWAELNQPRSKKTGKYKTPSALTRAFRFTKKWTLITGAFAVAVFIVSSMLATSEISYASDTVVINALPAKVAQLKHELFHKLVYQCESVGYKPGDDAIIWDTNNRASVGPAKFQIATVEMYYKMFYGKDLNDVEAVTLAMDYDRAEELGLKIIFEDKGKGINNWYNCNAKFDFSNDVAFINKLSN